jgi:hypothetical protein
VASACPVDRWQAGLPAASSAGWLGAGGAAGAPGLLLAPPRRHPTGACCAPHPPTPYRPPLQPRPAALRAVRDPPAGQHRGHARGQPVLSGALRGLCERRSL